VPIKRGESIGI